MDRGIKIKYDVIIIGAGPAGSTAAKYLSEEGLKVLLVDKSKFPRVKDCGGGVPAKAFKHFQYLKENNLVDSFSYGGIVYPPSRSFVFKEEREEPIIGMVIREKFDHGLVKLAIEAGTEFKDNKRVVDIKIQSDKAIVIFDDKKTAESEIIIGADGVYSLVGKKTGLVEKNREVSLSLYSEIPLDEKTMDKYFTKKRYGHMHVKIMGLAGYGWVFPKKNSVNIGLGEFKIKKKTNVKVNLKEYFVKYIQLLKDDSIIPSDLKVPEIHGATLPSRYVEKSYSERVLLVGDAAGLINPFTGEGIDYAMFSGKIAAETITESLKKKDTSANFLSKYQKAWMNNFGKDLKVFLKYASSWGGEDEKFLKMLKRDEKLSSMFVDIACGNLSIYENRTKLIIRYFYCFIKNIFKK